MERIRIACGQFDAKPGDKGHNLAKMEAQIAEAGRRGCRIIVFPEMAVTGYLPETEMPALAEPLEGACVSRISSWAKQNGISVVFGYPELDEKKNIRYNSFVIANDEGDIATVYRKIHLWDTEAEWAEPGTEVPVVPLAGALVSGWICYDTRFPEMGRLAYLKGAEVCLVPTAWLGPADEWILAVRARALDNALFVAGSDLINKLPGLECGGHSLIVDPKGRIIALAEAGVDTVIDAELDPAIFDSQRSRLPIMRDRRTELYGDLAEPTH